MKKMAGNLNKRTRKLGKGVGTENGEWKRRGRNWEKQVKNWEKQVCKLGEKGMVMVIHVVVNK